MDTRPGQPNGESLLASLFAVLQSSSDEVARQDASYTLAEIGGCSVSILATYIHDRNPKVRQHIITALGRLGDMEAEPYLIQSLRDEYWQVQGRSIVALSNLDPAILVRVLEILKNDDLHEWVVTCLLEWIIASGQLCDSAVMDFFDRVMESEKYSVYLRSRIASFRYGQ